MSIKGSQTEQNLLISFAGESQARNRYEFAAKVAKKEGFVQISEIFAQTAKQEQSHAKTFFKFLEGGQVNIQASFTAGKLGTTIENLEAAVEGEHEEWNSLYPEFATIARKEGFKKIATAWDMIINAEKAHEERFLKLLSNLRNNTIFEKEDEVVWECLKCGYTHKGKKALEKCPACNHPKAHFEVQKNNY